MPPTKFPSRLLLQSMVQPLTTPNSLLAVDNIHARFVSLKPTPTTSLEPLQINVPFSFLGMILYLSGPLLLFYSLTEFKVVGN